jgi:hypothetical protein
VQQLRQGEAKVGDTFEGAEERYRGEEGSVFVLRFRIQDTPELDL